MNIGMTKPRYGAFAIGDDSKGRKDMKMKRTCNKIVNRLLCTMVAGAMLITELPLTAYAAEASAPAVITEETAIVSDVSVPNDVSADSAEEAVIPVTEGEESSTSVGTVEVNQGMSIHTGLNDGNETYMNTFVAGKETVVMMKIPNSDSMSEDQAKSATANFKLEAKAVTNGQESDNCELTAQGSDSFTVKKAFTADCAPESGWYALATFPKGPDKGTYNFHFYDNSTEIGKTEGVTFYETKKLNILVVPVNGYWGGAYSGAAPSVGAFSCKNGTFKDPSGADRPWSDLISEMKTYMLDVYPIADVNFEEAKEFDGGNADYDMCNDNGQRKLWEDICKLQSKTKDGKDRYDLILAFVQYRQDQGAGQGYTFGKPTNIITYSDVDMLPTVVHEIAHCYQIGDEYNGGSFNKNVNFPPNGYSGRDFVSGENISSTSGAGDYWKSPAEFKSKTSGPMNSYIDTNGAGIVVSLSTHPYSLSQKKFVTWGGVKEDGTRTGSSVGPTITYMGSGYSGCDGYYWTSSVLWDHLFKQLVVKEKKDASEQQEQPQEEQSEEQPEQTNAGVFINALMSGAGDDENAIFTEDDFYYDDDYRFGNSRMVEVYGWLGKDDKGNLRVDMAPMFSYDGNLEYIEPLEDIYKGTNDVYTFAAVDKNGAVINSPVDGEYAAKEFYGGFFNASTQKVQKEVNFNFDAEYPKGTADFIIVKGSLDKDGKYTGEPIWKASEGIGADLSKSPEGYLVYADVNSTGAEVEWEVYYGSDEAYDGKSGELYTEVYYCPEGDEGEAYYVGCSEDENWEEGHYAFSTDAFDTQWTRNAYVWIKVTNGVNAIDIYSDENDVTLSNSVITLSGAGIKSSKADGETYYYAECTGEPIVPKVAVKAYDPSTGKYVSLKQDTDYTVSITDNTSVGYASVAVQGIGLYAGRNVQEFEIVQKTLAGTPGSIPDVVYSADLDKNVNSYITVFDAKNNQLVNGKDFTATFTVDGKSGKTLSALVKSNPEKEVPVTVEYKGKGNYTGALKTGVTFNVLPSGSEVTALSQAGTDVELKVKAMQYTGKALKPAVKSVIVKSADGAVQALSASNYKVIYTNNTSVGTGRVTVIGKNGYTGSAYATFAITPKFVSGLSVSGLKNQMYTGAEVDIDSLPITVKAGGITLTKGVDYTVEKIEGADYTGITAKGAQAPGVKISLITLTEEERAAKKSSEQPKVCWGPKVSDAKKTVTKTFKIVSTKLNSNAVSFALTSGKDETQNVVKSADKSKDIAYIRNATRDELAAGKKKYTLVITGEAAELGANADISAAAYLTAGGKKIDAKDYTVTVSKTKANGIGTITFKPVKGSSFTGSRSVKFLYQVTQNDEDFEDTQD